MARWNKERRLLDHEHSSHWKYRLQEVDEPNLMRDIFPYTEVARIDFDYKFVMPDAAGADAAHRHHLPGRPAGPAALYGAADRRYLRHAAPPLRAQRASSARASFSSIATRTRKR